MPRIRTLRPNVTREEATREFARGLGTALRNTLFGPVETVVEFYIPFRFFQVIASRGRQRKQMICGVDAVTGNLDPYQFQDLPGPEDVCYVETRNAPLVLLDEERARELLLRGLRRATSPMRGSEISAEPIAGEIYIPYWVGFRGRGMRARLAVMDAMRQRMEGAKVRRLLREWMGAVTVNN